MDGDRFLVERCLRDDASAWEELEARFRAVVRVVCGRFCRARGLPEADLQEEVLSEVRAEFVDPSRSLLRRYDSRWSLSTWIGQVAFSRCVDYLRREAVRDGAHKALGRETQRSGAERVVPGADEELERRDEAEHLRAAVDALPERQRAVLRAVFLDGRDRRDVAALLGVAHGSVAVLVSRALEALRRSITR